MADNDHSTGNWFWTFDAQSGETVELHPNVWYFGSKWYDAETGESGGSVDEAP